MLKESRSNVNEIFLSAIAAVNPASAVHARLKRQKNILCLTDNHHPKLTYNLNNYNHIYIVGAGKATAPMAKAAEDILGNDIRSGCIIVKYGYKEKLSRTQIIEAGHPLPDENGLSGAKEIIRLLSNAGEKDLIISLMSGGGSSLLSLPADPLTLTELQIVSSLLIKRGATINEINAVRKHLSRVKGGRLAKIAYPATVINLMISDVVGNDPATIASGPFVADGSTFEDSLKTIRKYRLTDSIPEDVLTRLIAGTRGDIEETPKENDPAFKKISNAVIAANRDALQAAKQTAEHMGYHAVILSSLFEGDTKEMAFFHSRIALEIHHASHPVNPPACIISGGETTVQVRGKGLGGRNMEFAMHSAVFIDGYNKITMASIGSDGTDGPTDAAGAVADGASLRRAREMGLSPTKYIQRNDSYHFFEALNDLIITGPTNTNVMDIRIMLIH